MLNPYQSQHLLGPVVAAINEAFAKLREFKATMAQTKDMRASVYKQGEAMVLKLKQQLEQGLITEAEMHRRCRAVTVWQSTKDSGLDVKLGEMEAEVCTRVEDASNMILDVWCKHVSKATPEHMVPIPEQDEIMMDADMDLSEEANMLREMEAALEADCCHKEHCIAVPMCFFQNSTDQHPTHPRP